MSDQMLFLRLVLVAAALTAMYVGHQHNQVLL